MAEGDEFLAELALAESAAVPEQVLVRRVALGPAVTLHHPDPARSPVVLDAAANSFEIAAALRTTWNVEIDEEILLRGEIAPTHVTLAVRWRELHRDLSLTGLLRNADPRARLTLIELDEPAALARVSGRFRGRELTVPMPLLDDSYSMWEAMYTFIEAGTKTAPRQEPEATDDARDG